MPDETQDLFSALDQAEGESPAIAAPPEPTPEPAPAPAPAEPVAASADPPVLADAAASPPPTPEPAAAPERTIPLAVLLEERKKADREYAALLSKLEAGQTRLEALERGQKPTAGDPAAADPDWLEDPKAYVDAAAARAVAAVKALEATGGERIAAVERSAGDMALDRGILAAQEQFVAKTPDFQDALVHARTARVQFLEAMNPGIDRAQVINAVAHEERQLAAMCLQRGINPAEHIYGLSKSMGYTPRQAAAAAAAAAPTGNGTSAAVVDPGLTLNSTPGRAASDATDEGEQDILGQAQAERFTRRRA
jgi:hypothetical protein